MIQQWKTGIRNPTINSEVEVPCVSIVLVGAHMHDPETTKTLVL